MSFWALIMAAGSGSRMGLETNKVLAELNGMTVLERSVRAFDGEVDGRVVVVRGEDAEQIRTLGLDAKIVTGGATRQQSVLNGLRALPEGAQYVLIHDAARPFVDKDTIHRCIRGAQACGSAVAGVPVKDTIKQIGPNGVIIRTVPRDTLRAAQTPQAFAVGALTQALSALEAQGRTMTDDAGAMEAAGHTVHMVDGAWENIKLTTPEDLAFAAYQIGGNQMRIGHGFDAHRLVYGRKLVLCGVEIPYDKGLMGHSDADVATHALMDALLGAAALGDIGKTFPDTDIQYEGISSLLLLQRVRQMLMDTGWALSNADLTIIAQRPKLSEYIPQMVEQLCGALETQPGQINIKATTTEGLGYEGDCLGISAHAVVLLQ